MIDLMKLIGKLDLDKLAVDFMERMKIQPFDLYFVILQMPDCSDYEVLGMAYSKETAREIKLEAQRTHRTGEVRALCLDIGKLIKVVEQFQVAYDIYTT